MSNSKPLPGPWEVESERDDGCAVISAINPVMRHGAFARVVVQMAEDDFESPHLVETAELIAALPSILKLLAAAKTMAEFGDINADMEDDGIGWKQWYIETSAVLAKAGVQL